ncbi:uncharacterized protein LOC122085880 isoform X2 [Macadamia integrifolia]|uniref:uncharacterized protein LOC122085880 isoform X2 n=1 Tax=Macadamia integrifolia TaxID=60698 RepID=UPI001C500988|nr:uncharacterized protein LOC122085880 isoform X2 [Macadamia integrifolia]
MASAATKIRFVRCPRCQKLLPELPELLLYKCGGCDTVLQAKNRKNGSSGSLENSSQKNQLEHASADVKSPSSGQIENHHEAKEFSSHLDAKEQLPYTDGKIEASGSRNFSSGVSSGELECSSSEEQLENQLEHDSENGKSTSSGQIENHSDRKQCSSYLNVKQRLKSTDCSIKPSGSRNFLKGVSSDESECSIDLNAEEQSENQLEHDSEDVKSNSSGQIENHSDTKECSSYLNVKQQLKPTDCSIKPSGSRTFLKGVSSGESECSIDLNAEEQSENQLEHDSEDVKSNSSGQIENHSDTKECSSYLNVKQQLKPTDCSIKPSGSSTFLKGVSSGESECSIDLNAEEQSDNLLEHDSEDVKSASSGQIENHSDTKECSSYLNAKQRLKSTDCSIEPYESRNFLKGVSLDESECSLDLNAEEQSDNQLENDSKDVKSTSSGQTENRLDTRECSSNLNEKEQIESADCSIEPSESMNFLSAVSSGDSECLSDLNAKEKVESTDCSVEPSRSRNFIDGVSSSDSLDLDSGKEQIESIDCSIKQSGSRSFIKEVASSDVSYHEREEKSSEAGQNTQADECEESQSPDAQLSSRGKSSSFTAQRQSDESNVTKMSSASSNQQLLQSHGISYHESDHTRSIETVEASGTTDNGNISEELSGTPRNIPNSRTARSSHAYDASVSSFDGWDDQVPEHPTNLPKRSWFNDQVVSDFASKEERPRRKDMFMNQKIIDDPELLRQLRKFFSMSSDEKHGLAVMDSLKWEGSRFQEQEQVGSPNSDGLRPIKNHMSSVSEEFWSRESSLRGFPNVYENGSPSNYGHGEFSSSTSARNSSKLDYLEQIELLRKVDELRDQLSRSYNQREMANEWCPARGAQQEKQQPPYYRSEQLDPEVPHWYDANHHRHPHVPFRTRRNRCQKCEFSQMHFSGQSSNRTNHVDYSCDHCCPEDWQSQSQFPPSITCCSKGPSRVHSGQMFNEPYNSSSATQQKYMDPYFSLQGSRMHSQEQVHMVHDVQKKYVDPYFSLQGSKMRSQEQVHMVHHVQKKYYQNRPQPVKRHCRPIAGGAPYIMCYKCGQLLQLPEDFISQKKIHQLQCSACSQVLKFSLKNRTHIIPYYPIPAVPPPSEVGNCSDYPQGDPVSYSEDCGPSMPSSSYSEANLKRKKKPVLKQSGNNSKTPIKASESPSASLNVAKLDSSSMEGEVAPRPSTSALHRLMGYSSVREIIFS